MLQSMNMCLFCRYMVQYKMCGCVMLVLSVGIELKGRGHAKEGLVN